MFDFDIIDTKTVLGESGFYLHKSNEIVFLDVLDPTLFIYSLENNNFYKEKIKLLNDKEFDELTVNLSSGIPVATPVFDGASVEDVTQLLKLAELPSSGQTTL